MSSNPESIDNTIDIDVSNVVAKGVLSQEAEDDDNVVTLTEFKKFLNLEGIDYDDDILQLALDSAISYCNKANETEYKRIDCPPEVRYAILGLAAHVGYSKGKVYFMKVGKLIHTITFYTTKYIDNGNGTGSNELIELRKVKCSIEDISYKDIQAGRRTDLERTLKVHTHYFKDFEIKGMKAKINNEADLYNVIYRENVNYKNIELIFTISKVLK